MLQLKVTLQLEPVIWTGRSSPQVYWLQAGVHQVIIGPFVNVSLFLDLVVVRQAVYFMNEYLKVDVCVYFVGSGHSQMQSAYSLHVVILPAPRDRDTKRHGRMLNVTVNVRCVDLWADLGVNDKDQRSGAPEDHFIIKSGVEKINLARKVPDLEADKGAAGHVFSADLIGALQEQRLAGGHFMEYHLLDGGFPAPTEPHQQNTRFDLWVQGVAEAQTYIWEEDNAGVHAE